MRRILCDDGNGFNEEDDYVDMFDEEEELLEEEENEENENPHKWVFKDDLGELKME